MPTDEYDFQTVLSHQRDCSQGGYQDGDGGSR